VPAPKRERETGREGIEKRAAQDLAARQQQANAPQRLWWLALDIGVRSDPRALFEWLDQVGAKECGESVAAFKLDSDEASLAKRLSGLVSDGIRLYLIGRHDGAGGQFGRLSGGRKRPPWEGFATDKGDIEAEED